MTYISSRNLLLIGVPKGLSPIKLSSSKGRIQDADFAAETSNLAKGQILQQAATAMLAQANASKQNVLALVR